jgi:hypothetical protein
MKGNQIPIPKPKNFSGAPKNEIADSYKYRSFSDNSTPTSPQMKSFSPISTKASSNDSVRKNVSRFKIHNEFNPSEIMNVRWL